MLSLTYTFRLDAEDVQGVLRERFANSSLAPFVPLFDENDELRYATVTSNGELEIVIGPNHG